MKVLSDFQDSHGFIGHLDDYGNLEFGDGSQRFGMERLFSWILAPGKTTRWLIATDFLPKYKSLFLETGEPVRHWDHFKAWYSRPGTMSRDGLFPLICCLAVMGYKRELLELAWKLIKRGGACWNTKNIGQQDEAWKIPDFVGPLTWLTIIRGLLNPNSWWAVLLGIVLYPSIMVCDLLFLTLAVAVRMIKPLFDWDDVGDDLNHFCLHLVNSELWATPISYGLFVVYLFRPPAGDPKALDVRSEGSIGVVQAFRWYFYGPKKPPLDELMQKTLNKVI